MMLPAQAHIRGCLSRTLQGSAQEFRLDDATGIVIGETRGIEGNDFHHISTSERNRT